jgi:5'-3' exonuclease
MLSIALSMGAPSMLRADTGSTAAIIAGAAAITGALIYDAGNHPYYVQSGHRYYVTQQQAAWYRGHHRGYERRAYVSEPEYPVARAYGNQGDRNQGDRNNDHGH